MAMAFPSVEVEIDFYKILDAYADIKNRERGEMNLLHQTSKDFPDATILPTSGHIFNAVDFEVSNMEWPDQVKDIETKALYEYTNPRGEEEGVYGDVASEEEVSPVNTVTITKGLMRDIRKTLKLRFPTELTDVKKAVGGSLEIDPSKQENVVPKKIKVRATLGRERIPRDGVTAVLECTEKAYCGTFSADIYPKGQVTLQGGKFGSQEIQDVIRVVSESPDHCGVLKHWNNTNVMTKEGSSNPKFFWKLQGFCDLRWGFKNKLGWEGETTAGHSDQMDN